VGELPKHQNQYQNRSTTPSTLSTHPDPLPGDTEQHTAAQRNAPQTTPLSASNQTASNAIINSTAQPY